MLGFFMSFFQVQPVTYILLLCTQDLTTQLGNSIILLLVILGLSEILYHYVPTTHALMEIKCDRLRVLMNIKSV